MRLRQEEHERRMWEEKIDAELQATHKRLELEKEARSTTAKLPKLIITPFKGTPTGWVGFENTFITPVQNKSISAKTKFGYLLEMVNPNVRAKIANRKPGETYKIACERLKSEYGQSKLVSERTGRRNSEPSCRQRIQLLEDPGILREREQKLRCVADNGRRRHASGIRVVHSQQNTESETRYCANRRKLGELGYGGLDKQPSEVLEKTK